MQQSFKSPLGRMAWGVVGGALMFAIVAAIVYKIRHRREAAAAEAHAAQEAHQSAESARRARAVRMSTIQLPTVHNRAGTVNPLAKYHHDQHWDL